MGKLLVQTLQDGAESFIVSVHEAAGDLPVVLFAVGAGGQPERYATLLNTLAESGCTVVAPHFERLRDVASTGFALVYRRAIVGWDDGVRACLADSAAAKSPPPSL
jgi:hypothetical protein